MKARIAVVGTGWWATANHLPALMSHPNAEIVAICDVDETKAQKAADEFDIKTIYTNLEALLAKEMLDGVMVATYHAAHYPVAKTCLEHGLHVYIEKPMVLFADQARELVKLADDKGLQIVMGYNHNHHDFVIRARDLVQNGAIGEIQFVTGQFSQAVFNFLKGDTDDMKTPVHGPGDVYSDPVRSGGGQGHLQTTHLAGMLFFVTNLRINCVQAMMQNLELNVDVVNAMTVQFDNGSLGTFGGTGNTRGGGRCFKLTVYGDKGWIDIDDANQKMVVYRDDHEPEQYATDEHPFFAPTHNFVDVIVGNAENLCPGLIGWRAVELLDAAYRSANDNGKAVYLDELYDEEAT